LVIVWLDPRTMTLEQLLSNIEKVAPRVLIAGKLVSRLFKLFQVFRRRVLCIKLVIGPKWLHLANAPILPRVPLAQGDDSGGLVVFTTGSTGPPKAVRLTSKCLAAQLDAYQILAENLGLGGAGDLVACHAALNFNAFDLALGNTTVTLPDPANPKNIKPAFLVDIDVKFKPVILTGSRVVFENLALYCEKHSPANFLSALQLGFAGGAPVSPRLHERVCKAIPTLKELMSAYGATEGLPLTVSGSHMTWDRADFKRRSREVGDGIALGLECPHVAIKLLKRNIADELSAKAKTCNEIFTWLDDWETKPGQYGELVVSSPSMSQMYVGDLQATVATKLKQQGTTILMHRTGDLCTRDEDGQIWMVGRMSQIVELADGTLIPPVCVESLFEDVPGVRRVAVVGPRISNNSVPVLVILRDFAETTFDHTVILAKLKASKWGSVAEQFKVLEYNTASSKPDLDFPMDTRHNSKIRREILQAWAQKRLG